jgi:PAS domain S-box-containing protein
VEDVAFKKHKAEGPAGPGTDEHERRRTSLLVFSLAIGIPVLLFFSLLNFFQEQYTTSLVDLLVALIFMICLAALRFAPGSLLIRRTASSVLTALLVYSLAAGGNHGSTILWMYVFPAMALFIFGRKEGAYWIAAVLLLVTPFVFYPGLGGTFPYDAGTRLRFPVSFLLVSIFSYYVESLRQRTHENLVREKEKAQKYFDIAGAMLLVLDPGGTVKVINKKGCEVLGYPEGEITGRDWFRHFLPEYCRDDVKKSHTRLMAGDVEPREFIEKPVLNKDGKERLIAWHNTVLSDSGGNNVCTLSSGEDITEKRQVEVEREEIIRKLRKALVEIRTLKGIIPICSYCKKIRDDKGFWNQVEAYITHHTEAKFSHGMCPQCFAREMKGLDQDLPLP